MTTQDLGKVAFKVLGLYFIIDGLSSFSGFLASAFMGEYAGGALSLLAYGLLRISAGLALIFYAEPITSRLLTGEKEPVTGHVSAEDIKSVAFSTVGVLVLAFAIPSVVNILRIPLASDSEWPGMVWWYILVLLPTAITIGLGVWLLFGSRGIVNGIRRLRKLGGGGPLPR